MSWHRGRHALIAFAAFAMSLISSSVHGQSVRWDFTGQVSWIVDPTGLLEPHIHLGDPVTATVQFDLSTPDSDSSSTRGTYYVRSGLLAVDINGLKFEQREEYAIDVMYHQVPEVQQVQAFSASYANVWPLPLPPNERTEILIAYWQYGPPFTFLANDQLPASIDLSVADDSHAYVRWPVDGGGGYEVQFQLTQVPEPNVAVLAGAALLLCWPAMRRKVLGRGVE